jgi:hypothetical protein
MRRRVIGGERCRSGAEMVMSGAAVDTLAARPGGINTLALIGVAVCALRQEQHRADTIRTG